MHLQILQQSMFIRISKEGCVAKSKFHEPYSIAIGSQPVKAGPGNVNFITYSQVILTCGDT